MLMARGHVKGQNKLVVGSPALAPRVLVIDDDPVLLRSLARLLKAHGLDVATAGNGREGLAIFRKISPAVVLTDILMPIMDGTRTITAIRRERPDVKIIAMSGGSLTSDFLAMAKKLGADNALEKPFDVSVLVAMIRRHLRPPG